MNGGYFVAALFSEAGIEANSFPLTTAADEDPTLFTSSAPASEHLFPQTIKTNANKRLFSTFVALSRRTFLVRFYSLFLGFLLLVLGQHVDLVLARKVTQF